MKNKFTFSYSSSFYYDPCTRNPCTIIINNAAVLSFNLNWTVNHKMIFCSSLLTIPKYLYIFVELALARSMTMEIWGGEPPEEECGAEWRRKKDFMNLEKPNLWSRKVEAEICKEGCSWCAEPEMEDCLNVGAYKEFSWLHVTLISGFCSSGLERFDLQTWQWELHVKFKPLSPHGFAVTCQSGGLSLHLPHSPSPNPWPLTLSPPLTALITVSWVSGSAGGLGALCVIRFGSQGLCRSLGKTKLFTLFLFKTKDLFCAELSKFEPNSLCFRI